MLQSAWNQIERAFDRLEARWRILTKPGLKFDTILLIIYTCFILHNYSHTKSACALDADEVKAYMERHKLKKANMAGKLDPACCSNIREGEYIRRRITK